MRSARGARREILRGLRRETLTLTGDLRAVATAHLRPLREPTRGGGGGHGGGGHGGGGHGFGGFGGGHSFGGGYHSYGSGGGGSGIGDIFGAIVLLIVLFIIIAIVFLIIRVARKNNSAADGGARPQTRELEAIFANQPAAFQAARNSNIAGPLSELRAADPDFEPETFLQRAEMTYFLVNRAMQHRDASALQPYLSPDLFAKKSAEVKTLIDAHQKPSQLDLNIRGMHVNEVRHDGAGDAILVHFDYVSRDRIVDDRDERKIVWDAGDDLEAGASWMFSRKAGAKSVASGGVIAAKCPVCGAPLKLDVAGHCSHCNSAVTSGEHDWIVTSMAPSQFLGPVPDEFLGGQTLEPHAGFASISSSDPSFAADAFLKRCASAFDSLETAWQARDLTEARGFMSPGLYFSWQAQVEQLQERHRKNVLEHLRLDSVTPIRVTHGSAFDNVMVRMAATCADYEVDDQTGHIVFGDKHPSSFVEFWTFQRGVGVKTSGKAGTLEKLCPNCGAPLDVNAVGECKYCQAAVTSGKFDWVLSRIEQADDVSV